MTADPDDDGIHQQRLQDVLAAFYEAAEGSGAPDRRALFDRHPDLAAELAEFFAVSDQVRHLAAPFRANQTTPGETHRTTNSHDGRPPFSSHLGGDDIVGDYELLDEIARGGMGIVYRARQRSLGRLVALKLIRDGARATREDAKRFRSEAEALASLDHPHIVPIYEVGNDCGCSFLSMKLIEGRSLAERLTEYGSDPRAGARLLATVARAVHHAHERGILHRDLKPSNVLIDGQGCPLVADFGLARRLERDIERTEPGAVLGTPAYMAPEQAMGWKGAVTIATDVHGLGTILYALLTGRPPFRSGTPLETLEQAREHAPELPSTTRTATDRDLETICLKCLEKDPRNRYGSALAVAEDLERWLKGRPILARPVGFAERAWRLCRRSPRITALAATAILSLVSTVIGIGATWQAHHDAARMAQQNRRAEEAARSQQYPRDVKRASELWADNRPDQALALLERYRPAPEMEDLRSFAWHYFHRVCTVAPLPLLGHEGDVYFASFSADGKTLATAGKDRTVRLWDPATGATRSILRGHTDEVDWVSFSPDGRTLATTGDDGTVRIWDVETAQLKSTLTGHDDEVVAAIFTPDGRRVISGGRKGKVILWNLETSHECRSFAVKNRRLQSMAISPDGATLAIAGDWVVISDLVGRCERHLLKPHAGQANGVAFSHDGRSLATACNDVVEVWEISSGERKAAFPGHSGAVESVAFAPDDRSLASVGGGVIELWDGASGTKDSIAKSQGRLWCVAFSPDGRSLATTSADGSVKLWNLQRDRASVSFSVPTGGPLALAFSPNGARLFLADAIARNSAANLWIHESKSGQLLEQKRFTVGDGVACSSLTSDASRLVTLNGAGKITLWDIGTERYLKQFLGPAPYMCAMSVSPGGEWIAEWVSGQGALFWDAASDSPRHLGGIWATDKRSSILLSPQGKCSLWGEAATTPTIWDPVSGRSLGSKRSGHRTTIRAQAFSADGTTLATGGLDGTVILWDMESLDPLYQFYGAHDAVTALAFSPDGRTLATGGSDTLVRLWDLKTCTELATLKGHANSVAGVCFSPDGLTIASYSALRDCQRVILWPAGPTEPASGRPVESASRGDSRNNR